MITVDLPSRRDTAGTGSKGLVGRDQLLLSVATRLAGPGTEVALTSSDAALSLHGGGGIGKTAVALEYCHTQAGSAGYETIWWVNAYSDTTTASSFQALIARLGGNTENPDIRVEADRLLSTSGKWLAVFDNVEDREAFERWCPQATGGSILVTTRSTAKWDAAQSIPVDLIDDSAAEDWLLEAAGEPTDQVELDAASELVEELGGLALALTMAASYIHNTPVALSEYLRLFRQSPVHLLADRTVDVGQYDKTVYTALAVSRDQLKATDQDAALLMLEYASFYAPDDIPMSLFTPDGLGVETETEVLQAKRALAERSLITPAGDDAFNVHRLVQSVTRYYLEHPLPEKTSEAADAHDDTEGALAAAEPSAMNPTPTVVQPIFNLSPDNRPPRRLELANWVAGIFAAVVAAVALAFAVGQGDGDDDDRVPDPDSGEVLGPETAEEPGSSVDWPEADRVSGATAGTTTTSGSGLIEFRNGEYNPEIDGFVDGRFIAPDGSCFFAPDLTPTSVFMLPVGPGYRVSVRDMSPSYVSLELQADAAPVALMATTCSNG